MCLRLQNWMPQVRDGFAALANYNFSLHYRSGKTNVEADALSRIPNAEGEMSIDRDAIRAIANAMQIRRI